MLRFVTAVAIFGLAMGQRSDIAYEDCGSKAEILSAQTEPCDSDPCVVKRGETTRIFFTFISDQDSDTLTLDAKFELFSVMMSIPGLESDLCKGTIQCPVVKGQTYSGIIEADVPWFVPAMKSTVQFTITGDKGVSVCAKTKIIVE
uniref:MD-2-related lipid-recognition domain-containing protein n=1 Tax=Amblyomma maculatum TaxID=34609 RepID=G3MMV0_AMBMU